MNHSSPGMLDEGIPQFPDYMGGWVGCFGWSHRPSALLQRQKFGKLKELKESFLLTDRNFFRRRMDNEAIIG